MASLREIKDHIGSVRSTLKITSAMKLVSSAKLRKAQQAAEGIRPYTEALAQMLACVMGAEELSSPQAGLTAPPIASDGPLPLHPWADRASASDTDTSAIGINTAIVLPDEGLLIPVLNSIPESVEDVNVTMGYPMQGSVPYRPCCHGMPRSRSNRHCLCSKANYRHTLCSLPS